MRQKKQLAKINKTIFFSLFSLAFSSQFARFLFFSLSLFYS